MIGAASLTPTPEETIARFRHVMEADTESIWILKNRKSSAKLLTLLHRHHPAEGPKTAFVQLPVIENEPPRVKEPRQRFTYDKWMDDIGDRNGVPQSVKITMADIQEAVARHYRLPRSAILCAGRFASVARPRQVSYYLARHLLKRSLAEIGRHTGGRDHTSSLHGIRKIETLLTLEHGLNLTIAAILNRLGCSL